MLISIVVPVYKEEKNIPEFLSRVVTILEKISSDFEIIFSMETATGGASGTTTSGAPIRVSPEAESSSIKVCI